LGLVLQSKPCNSRFPVQSGRSFGTGALFNSQRGIQQLHFSNSNLSIPGGDAQAQSEIVIESSGDEVEREHELCDQPILSVFFLIYDSVLCLSVNVTGVFFFYVRFVFVREIHTQ